MMLITYGQTVDLKLNSEVKINTRWLREQDSKPKQHTNLCASTTVVHVRLCIDIIKYYK